MQPTYHMWSYLNGKVIFQAQTVHGLRSYPPGLQLRLARLVVRHKLQICIPMSVYRSKFAADLPLFRMFQIWNALPGSSIEDIVELQTFLQTFNTAETFMTLQNRFQSYFPRFEQM